MTVSLQEVKAHLNLDHDQDDDLLTAKIAAAETYIDGFLDRKFADYEADDEPVPAIIKQAVMMVAAHLFENREHVLVGVSAQTLPLDALDLIAGYRAWSFG